MRLYSQAIRFWTHFNQIKKLLNGNLDDYYVATALAMECFQAANSLIDIATKLVSENSLGFPQNAVNAFELLMKHGLIEKEELEAAKRAIYLRNLIAHEYHAIEKEDLLDLYNALESLQAFVRRAEIKNGES